MTDILWQLWHWLDALDEVAILRVSYTTASILGAPYALWCLWSSIKAERAIRRAGLNGGLGRSARGYRRRDHYYVGVLLLTASAGLIAMFVQLPLRTPFGLAVWLVIAIWTTRNAIADYHDRRAEMDEALP